MLPPLSTRPTFLPASCAFSFSAAASGTRAGAFAEIVRIRPIGANRFADFFIRYRDHAGYAAQDDFKRSRIGHARRHAISVRIDGVGGDRAAGSERQRVSRRALGADADDLGLPPQRVARSDGARDAGAEADRHIEHVEIGVRAKQLQRIGRDAAHEIAVERRYHFEAFGRGIARRLFAGGLKVRAVLDETRAVGAHRRVLLNRIADRREDDWLDAGARGREGEALAVVAARGGDERAGLRRAPLELIDVGKAAAHLEGAGRVVVLVFDDDLSSEPTREQRPSDGGRRRKHLAHKRFGSFEFGEGEHGVATCLCFPVIASEAKQSSGAVIEPFAPGAPAALAGGRAHPGLLRRFAPRNDGGAVTPLCTQGGAVFKPASCLARRSRCPVRSRHHLQARPAAFRYAPCPRGSSGNSFLSDQPRNRRSPASAYRSSP